MDVNRRSNRMAFISYHPIKINHEHSHVVTSIWCHQAISYLATKARSRLKKRPRWLGCRARYVIQSSLPRDVTSSAFVPVHRSWRTVPVVPPLPWLATISPPLGLVSGVEPGEITWKKRSVIPTPRNPKLKDLLRVPRNDLLPVRQWRWLKYYINLGKLTSSVHDLYYKYHFKFC